MKGKTIKVDGVPYTAFRIYEETCGERRDEAVTRGERGKITGEWTHYCTRYYKRGKFWVLYVHKDDEGVL